MQSGFLFAIFLCLQLLGWSCRQSPRPSALLLDSTWSAPEHLAGPCDLEILPGNKILVSDSSLQAIFVFNESGKELTRISHSSLGHPTALAALSASEFFVADIAGNSLLRFNLGGVLLHRFGDEGRSKGLMLRPMGLTLAPDSTLWMTEHGNRRVQAFGATTQVFYGAPADDSLQTPTGIVAARDGSVYVTDTATPRIWHLSAEMKVLSQWGKKEGLQKPLGVALDRFENIFVAEAGRSLISVFSEEGKLLFEWKLNDLVPGASPTALAFDAENRLYVMSLHPRSVQRGVVQY